MTLYAQWKENPSYFINYNLNEGTNPDDVKTSYKQDETVVLPVPTRELYDFAGWYLAQDFSGESITGWNAGEKTGDVTLYVKWTVTAENVVTAINNLTEGTHSICVVGKIDETTVKNIGAALRSNENAKVNLDLSKTTGLEDIPSWAFEDCTSLTNIKIPTSVTSIGTGTFMGCTGLTDVEFLANVRTISGAMFRECTSLTCIKIPESVRIIDNAAFYKCTSLTNIELPESVISIDNYVFYECISLTNIEISESVTKIGRSVFYGCSSLTTVNYMSTIEQWKKIDISEIENDSLLTAKIICSDGIINGE